MTVVRRSDTDEPALRAVPALEDGEAFAQVEQPLNRVGFRTDAKRDGLIARCPAHDDGTPSRSVADVGGKALLHGFADFDTSDTYVHLLEEVHDDLTAVMDARFRRLLDSRTAEGQVGPA